MTRALLLLLATVAAQAQIGPELARADVLDAAGTVRLADATPESRTVAVTCPAGATCRLMAAVEAVSGGPVAVGLVAGGLVTPPGATAAPRVHACRAAGPCELASGLPTGRSFVTLGLEARADALAPAGAHPFPLRLWVLTDPDLGGDAVAPLRSPSLFTPLPQ